MEKKSGKETKNILKNPSDYIRLAMVGNVDSGKSTLVGVLTKGLNDDGRGSARRTSNPLNSYLTYASSSSCTSSFFSSSPLVQLTIRRSAKKG